MKASLISRICAYLIDIVIVTFVASLIASFIPQSKNVEKLYKEQTEVVEKYFKDEIKAETYYNRMLDLSYDMAKQTPLTSVIQILVTVLYFCVFQFYQKGQTLGKKLLKIKVKKQGKEKLTMNDLVVRSCLIDSILLNVITTGLLLFASKNVYLYGGTILESIQYAFIIISFFCISFSKDKTGLHDKLLKTEVVRVRARKEEVEEAE